MWDYLWWAWKSPTDWITRRGALSFFHVTVVKFYTLPFPPPLPFQSPTPNRCCHRSAPLPVTESELLFSISSPLWTNQISFKCSKLWLLIHWLLLRRKRTEMFTDLIINFTLLAATTGIFNSDSPLLFRFHLDAWEGSGGPLCCYTPLWLPTSEKVVMGVWVSKIWSDRVDYSYIFFFLFTGNSFVKHAQLCHNRYQQIDNIVEHAQNRFDHCFLWKNNSWQYLLSNCDFD